MMLTGQNVGNVGTQVIDRRGNSRTLFQHTVDKGGTYITYIHGADMRKHGAAKATAEALSDPDGVARTPEAIEAVWD